MLGVVVLVVALLALREPKVTSSSDTGTPRTRTVVSTVTNSPTPSKASSSTRASSPPTSTSSSAATGVKAIPLIVLNNTSISGLAKTATDKFAATGGR